MGRRSTAKGAAGEARTTPPMTRVRPVRGGAATTGTSKGKSMSKKSKSPELPSSPSSSVVDEFEFNEEDHDISSFPTHTTTRTRQDTPIGSSKKKKKSMKAPVSTPPRFGQLSRSARTPPRFGMDTSMTAEHTSLSPVAIDMTVGEESELSSTPSPREVWNRALRRDPARLVAPVQHDLWDSLGTPLSTAKSRKRSLSPSVRASPSTSVHNTSADSVADGSVPSESPKKKQRRSSAKSTTPSPARLASPPSRGRRSSRLEHETLKNLKEVSTDEEEQGEDDDARSAITSNSRSRPSTAAAPRARPKHATISPLDDTEEQEHLEKMKAYFEELQATPIESLIKFRTQR